MESLAFELLDAPNDATTDVTTVEKGLISYNKDHLGEINYQKLAIVVKSASNDVIGGLVGSTLCGWVYVVTLWVADEHRNRGIDKRLMALAEEEGRRRGCHHIRLETSEVQAPDFYIKLGYSVFGILDDYPKGLKLYFFKKLCRKSRD
jgi:ribosomal protein S18 acetylase RimI-like enzyme